MWQHTRTVTSYEIIIYFRFLKSLFSSLETGENFFFIMAMSGIVVSDECMSAHEQLKVKHSLRYIIFNIEKVDKCGKKEDTIVVQKTVTRDDAELWKDFCEEFPEDDCRYALFDLPLKTKDNQATDKLLMIYWYDLCFTLYFSSLRTRRSRTV